MEYPTDKLRKVHNDLLCGTNLSRRWARVQLIIQQQQIPNNMLCWYAQQQALRVTKAPVDLCSPVHLLIEHGMIIRPSMDEDDYRSRIKTVDKALELCASHGKERTGVGTGRWNIVETTNWFDSTKMLRFGRLRIKPRKTALLGAHRVRAWCALPPQPFTHNCTKSTTFALN